MIVTMHSFFGVPALTSKASVHHTEQLKIGPTRGKCTWQKRADFAAAVTRSSSNLSESQAQSKTLQSDPMTGTSGPATSAPTTTPTTSATKAATPKRVLVDKSVATEGQYLEQQLGHQEAEFIRGLVSLVLEVIQVQQSRRLISRTDSGDGPGNPPATGRGRDEQ